MYQMETIPEVTEEDFEDDESISSTVDSEYTHFHALGGHDGSIQHTTRQESCQDQDPALQSLHKVEKTSQSCCWKVDTGCFLKCIEVTVLGVIIGLIWISMAIPTALYIKTTVFSSTSEPKSSNISNHSNTSAVCSESVEYTGTVCREYLLDYQLCAEQLEHISKENHSGVFITDLQNQETVENMAAMLQNYLDALSPTSECRHAIIPFTCLYLFNLSLCDLEKRTSTIIRPSSSTCQDIKNNVCKTEWELASQLVADKLPDCSKLPKISVVDQCKENKSSNGTNDNLNLNCSKDFFFDNKTQACQPVCAKWSSFTPQEVLISDLLVVLTMVFAVLTGVTVLILSCIRCNRIFRYPSIFVVYQTLDVMLVVILVLLGFAFRDELFCSNRNLKDSIFQPSIFCIISGIVFYYCVVQMVLWWMFHVIAVFHGTMWPFKVRMLKSAGRIRYLHTFMVLFAILFPLLPVAAVGKIGGGFTMVRFPPILCVGPNTKANFYAMVLPLSVILGIGSSLLTIIFWTVIKNHIQAKLHQLRVKRMNWTTEARVMIVLFYYVLLGAVILSIFTNSLINVEGFIEDLLNYFNCESKGINMSAENDTMVFTDDGNNNSTCNLLALEKHTNYTATLVSFVLLGLYPAVNLVYTVHINDLKKNCSCIDKRRVEFTPRESRFVSRVSGVHNKNVVVSRPRSLRPDSALI